MLTSPRHVASADGMTPQTRDIYLSIYLRVQTGARSDPTRKRKARRAGTRYPIAGEALQHMYIDR